MEDKIVVQHEIEHDGEINRIKHHPKKTNLIATRTPLGEVHIFDKMTFKTGRVKVNPSIILTGHETEGYSLEWNPNRDGYIIAGSYDGNLTLWDISSREQNNRVAPLCYFNHHQR
jgi:histone-binding protein RBBP4